MREIRMVLYFQRARVLNVRNGHFKVELYIMQ